MILTYLDKELLDRLQLLTDEEISRVQAHLAAGLPMQRSFGWGGVQNEPSCFGCLIGTSMTREEFNRRTMYISFSNSFNLVDLAFHTFLGWANEGPDFSLNFSLYDPLPAERLSRLSMLLDMEWKSRQGETLVFESASIKEKELAVT